MNFEQGFPERLRIKTYDDLGNVITEWDDDAGWFEDGMEQNEYGEWLMNRVYHPYTAEQRLAIEAEKIKTTLANSRRDLTFEEVVAFLIKAQVNTFDIPDQMSLRMKSYYPEFSELIGQTVNQGFKFTYENKLYKTIQPDLMIQSHYPPGVGTESLYTRVDFEHTGAMYDPIPYEGNMELFEGKYYSQTNVVYLCTRNTGSAVYHALVDLVGLYVEPAEPSNLS